MIKRLFRFLILIFSFYLSLGPESPANWSSGRVLPFAFSYADTVDKVIVVVNDETITQGELDMATAALLEKLKTKYSGGELVKEAEKNKKEILNRMIEEKLILSEAKKRKIEASDAEIEVRLKEIKSTFGSEEEFNEALRQEGVSLNELKQRYADQVKMGKLVEMEVRKKMTINPSETLNYYNLNKEKFREPEEVKLKNILIKSDEKLSGEDARALAEKILGFLKAGENFDELALKYSKGPNADIGGDLGYVKKGQMRKEIEDIVFNLNAGQLSEVVKTHLGYHIFKVEEKKPEGIKELNEAKDEIEKVLFLEKGKQRYKDWIEAIKKNAYISFR